MNSSQMDRIYYCASRVSLLALLSFSGLSSALSACLIDFQKVVITKVTTLRKIAGLRTYWLAFGEEILDILVDHL